VMCADAQGPLQYNSHHLVLPYSSLRHLHLHNSLLLALLAGPNGEGCQRWEILLLELDDHPEGISSTEPYVAFTLGNPTPSPFSLPDSWEVPRRQRKDPIGQCLSKASNRRIVTSHPSHI
jgi:hypothetical protein